VVLDSILVVDLARGLASTVRVSAAVPNPVPKADSFAIAVRSWPS
jgi:hypothetical protein